MSPPSALSLASAKIKITSLISNGIYTIASDNEKDFLKFLEFKILNPFKKP
jgi:hypothetical protein